MVLKIRRVTFEAILRCELLKSLGYTYSAYSGPAASLPVRSLTDSVVRSLPNNGNPTTWMDQLSARIEYPYVREMY